MQAEQSVKKESSDSVKAFKEKTSMTDEYVGVEMMADQMLGPVLGSGVESKVYEADSDTVIKISQSSKNLRGEYVVFADPQFSYVTPDAIDHHEAWKWIQVEKVNTIGEGNWQELFSRLPETRHILSQSSSDIARGFEQAVRKMPEWVDDLPEKERAFFKNIHDLHDALDVRAIDVNPGNIGIDSENNLVLFDIFLDNV
jgi:hypothetical protein